MPTVTVAISDNADDVMETGGVNSASNWPANIGRWSDAARNGGYRFQAVAVPQGATISSAILTLWATGSNSALQMTLYAAAIDNAEAWSSTVRPSTVAITAAGTALTTVVTDINTYDVTTAVQEVISRAGWVSGNALAIVLLWTGAAVNQFVGIVDYSLNDTEAASLAITYTTGGGATLVIPAVVRRRPAAFVIDSWR